MLPEVARLLFVSPLTLVTSIGVIVVRNSRHYLRAVPRITGPADPLTEWPADSARTGVNTSATSA